MNVETELGRLQQEPVEYNGYLIRPSALAWANARMALLATYNVMIEPELTPDGDQGIDIEWEKDGREVCASCRGDGSIWLVSREKNAEYIGHAPAELQERLAWLG